jgi:hypothetical protein
MSRNPIDTAVTKDIRYGHKVVGATAVQLTTVSAEMNKGVLLRAPGDSDPTPNTAPIWVGTNASVTANSNAETGGLPVVPGAALEIPAKDAQDIWLISTAAAQDIAWIGV